MISRNKDVITGKEDLEHLHIFKDFPVFFGCTTAPQSQDQKADMHWFISRGSGCIQLNPCVPLDILYKAAHGSGTVGKTWTAHHKAFAKFIERFSNSSVLEIGGGGGTLSREYHKLHPETEWTIVEPNPTPLEGVRARYIKAFMDENFVPDREYQTIVHSHTWEHIYDPKNFIKHISAFMPVDSIQIFSVPDLGKHLERYYFSSCNFEHTYFLIEEYINYFMKSFGWELIEQESYGDRHSLFYAWRKKTNAISYLPDFSELYHRNKKLFLAYCHHYETIVQKYNKNIVSCKRKIFLFGGHLMSQYLLSLGLYEDKIISLLDNDPLKQQKRLYGSRLYVQSPNILSMEDHPVVILNAGAYQQEIKDDILTNINPHTEFWE